MRFAPLALIVALVLPSVAMAQPRPAPPSAVTYAPGWDMVGGPAGTDFSPAQALLSYDGSAYVAASSGKLSPCQGAWAYFTAANTVVLSDQAAPGQSQSCAVVPGWTMVGNPFLNAPALLPGGAAAFFWNASAGRYDTVSSIPVGGAVWIFSTVPSSVTLTQAPASTGGITITFAPSPSSSPYQVRVGETVTFIVPGGQMGWTPSTDPAYLQLEASGQTLSFPPDQFWRWRAIKAGPTDIVVSAACRLSTPPCEVPDFVVRVAIGV